MAGADVAAPASSALITIQFPLAEKEKETGFLVTRRLGRGGKILFFSLKNSRQSNEIKGKTRSRTNERSILYVFTENFTDLEREGGVARCLRRTLRVPWREKSARDRSVHYCETPRIVPSFSIPF